MQIKTVFTKGDREIINEGALVAAQHIFMVIDAQLALAGSTMKPFIPM
jgi:hypothetical protein